MFDVEFTQNFTLNLDFDEAIHTQYLLRLGAERASDIAGNEVDPTEAEAHHELADFANELANGINDAISDAAIKLYPHADIAPWNHDNDES